MKPIPITRLQPEGKWLHQTRAFWFAYDKPASMLAITMGGGKTKIAIDLILNWHCRDVLIIAPKNAIEDAWGQQLKEHMTKKYQVALCVNGSVAQRTAQAQEIYNCVCTGITVINHEAFWREPFRSWAMDVEWDLVIADESHREKAAGSRQSQGLYRLGMRATRRLCLTGTPMPHSPLDVYGQYRFLDHSIFGTNNALFQQRYAVFGGYQFREVIGFKNLDDLNKKFYSIGIVIEDSAQGLPETVDITHSVKLMVAVKDVYDELDREFIAKMTDGEITAANAGVKLLRLHQMACGVIKYDGEKRARRLGWEKINAVQEILNDLPDGEPVVIFTRFDLDTQDLATAIPSTSQLSGLRNELAEWKRGETRVLVAQIQAAKEGIDLTRAAVAIFYSTGISLGDYEQCRKRLHRPPQARMVRFIHILARGTRDVSTMRALAARKDVIRETLREIEEGKTP